MSVYRITRNLEASIIDYIKSQLIAYSWTGVTVEKGFEIVYDNKLPLPVIAIRSESSVKQYGEIGDNAEERNYQIFINIFATSDGQRLDLKDFLISILKVGCPFYEYTITQSGRNATASKTQNGRITFLRINDTSIKFDVDKDKLMVYDRFRHLLTCTISNNKIL